MTTVHLQVIECSFSISLWAHSVKKNSKKDFKFSNLEESPHSELIDGKWIEAIAGLNIID